MIKYGEVGPRPVEYLVLAWISGIGTALMVVVLGIVIAVAYSGQFGDPTWEQVLVGLVLALFVALSQLFLAQTACFAILHSRSSGAPINDAIGTGFRTIRAVVALPFETTDQSRFWVAVYRSGWRVFIAIYAVVLAVILSSGTHSALPAVPLVAVAVALGYRHARYVPKDRAKTIATKKAVEVRQTRIDAALDAKQREAERHYPPRPAGVTLTDEWIDRELSRVFTPKAIRAVQDGDLAALDKPLRRAYVAMNKRVEPDLLREHALAWVRTRPHGTPTDEEA